MPPAHATPTSQDAPTGAGSGPLAASVHRAATEVLAHAAAAWPLECCGWITASGRARPCRNAQDELHALDPVAWPGTSREAYYLSAEDQFDLVRALDGEDPPRIVYHSHPDGTAAFSRLDRERALFDGRPVYPQLSFLVIGCGPNGPTALCLYEWDGSDYRGQFLAFPRLPS